MVITPEGILIALGWLLSVLFGFLVYPKIAARKTMQMFGLVRVQNGKGEEIYAATDPDGEPIKVPVARAGQDGKITVTQEYAGLAYSLPTLAAIQLKASLTGKAGKMVQEANAAVLEGMDINQAATAMALQAFAKGQYGKALMAYLTPRIAASINQGGQAGQSMTQSPVSRGRGPI